MKIHFKDGDTKYFEKIIKKYQLEQSIKKTVNDRLEIKENSTSYNDDVLWFEQSETPETDLGDYNIIEYGSLLGISLFDENLDFVVNKSLLTTALDLEYSNDEDSALFDIAERETEGPEDCYVFSLSHLMELLKNGLDVDKNELFDLSEESYKYLEIFQAKI